MLRRTLDSFSFVSPGHEYPVIGPPPTTPSPPCCLKLGPATSVSGSFEGQPACLCLQMRRSEVSGVDVANVPTKKLVLCPHTAAQPWSSCVGGVGGWLRIYDVAHRAGHHTEHSTVNMKQRCYSQATRMNGKETAAWHHPCSPARPVQTTLGDSDW